VRWTIITRSVPLSGGRFDDLATLVMAAMRTHPVGQLALLAIRADGSPRLRQSVVGASLVAAGSGVASFWVRHRVNP
jgi:hypothetical protein